MPKYFNIHYRNCIKPVDIHSGTAAIAANRISFQFLHSHQDDSHTHSPVIANLAYHAPSLLTDGGLNALSVLVLLTLAPELLDRHKFLIIDDTPSITANKFVIGDRLVIIERAPNAAINLIYNLIGAFLITELDGRWTARPRTTFYGT